MPDVAQEYRGSQVTFTTSDISALIQSGAIPEDGTIELLEGLLIRKDRAATGQGTHMIGQAHRNAVERLAELRPRFIGTGCFMVNQQPLWCAEDHLPEPDAAVLRGSLDDYGEESFLASDTLCVIEVADSSYERDAGPKLVRYARARVPMYVIVNLRDRRVEVFTLPLATGKYEQGSVLGLENTLQIPLANGASLSVPVISFLRA
jgi:Uma2 family endonuclease